MKWKVLMIFVIKSVYHVNCHEATVKLRACAMKRIDDSGIEGDLGERGDKAADGPIGPPGLPGMPGICPCDLITVESRAPGDSGDFGNPTTPLQSTCKTEFGDRSSNDTYYFGTPKNSFKAVCSKQETCILEGKPITVSNIEMRTDPFWLSQTGIDLIDMYKLEIDHIEWLQNHATSVRQTIKYQCKKSKQNATTTSIKLRSWNHVVIGPSPTDSSPVFYNMSDGDLCAKVKEGETASALIEIHHTNENRLPITDIWFNSISPDDEITFENVELCFI